MNDPELASAAAALEIAGDLNGALRLVSPVLQDPGRAGRVALMAFSSGGLEVAKAIVADLRPRSVDLFLIILAALFAGLRGDAATAAREVGMVRNGVAQIPPDVAEKVFRLLEPVFANSVSLRTVPMYADVHHELVMTLSPVMRAIFTADVSVGGDAAFMPVSLFPPPPLPRRRPRRVLVALPERFYPSVPTSRLFDVGPRIVAAAANYGWAPRFVPLDGRDAAADWRTIEVAVAAAGDVDLVVGGEGLFTDAALPPWIEDLRRSGTRLAATVFDPWVTETAERLAMLAGQLDLVWGPFPTVPAWANPALAGKTCFSTFPTGFAMAPPAGALPDAMTFLGDIQPANWPRLSWLTAARHAGLPLLYQASKQGHDGCDSLTGYRAYMEALRGSGIAVNMSLRRGGSRPVTGRSFEAPLAGALLVQEEASDMPCFFQAGRHYLPFRTVGDLRRVWEFIRDDPAGALTIRQAGYDFAQSRYGDDAIMGDIDCRLFGAAED